MILKVLTLLITFSSYAVDFVPFDQLDSFNEVKKLSKDHMPKIYSIGPVLEGKEPLLLVHGFKGHVKDFKMIISAFERSRYQIYFLAYDSFEQHTKKNASGFGEELAGLLKKEKRITIIAHSMGGIITRQALNHVTREQLKGKLEFEKLRVISIDSPWHGYKGPADDEGIEELLVFFTEPFIPKGLVDMRAEAEWFIEDPERYKKSILGRPLSPQIELSLIFAQKGHEVHDYTEEAMKFLPEKMANFFNKNTPMEGTAQEMNFWRTLKTSHHFFDFRLDVRRIISNKGSITADGVTKLLLKHYPRFPGNHVTVLSEQETIDYIKHKIP